MRPLCDAHPCRSTPCRPLAPSLFGRMQPGRLRRGGGGKTHSAAPAEARFTRWQRCAGGRGQGRSPHPSPAFQARRLPAGLAAGTVRAAPIGHDLLCRLRCSTHHSLKLPASASVPACLPILCQPAPVWPREQLQCLHMILQLQQALADSSAKFCCASWPLRPPPSSSPASLCSWCARAGWGLSLQGWRQA